MGILQPINEAQRGFIQALTEGQIELFSYICVALGNTHDASDILQETNVQLWIHSAEYDASRPFLPWARAFAFNQIRAFLKTRSRERLVFNEELIRLFAERVSDTADNRLEAVERLNRCIENLTSGQRALLTGRYWENRPVSVLARFLNVSADAVYVQLHRIRQLLAACIRRKTRKEGV